MGDKSRAFFKGGIGCIIAFIVFGIICLALGGSMHLDIGGVILLLVIGGILGLIVNAIYNKGKKDSQVPTYKKSNEKSEYKYKIIKKQSKDDPTP